MTEENKNGNAEGAYTHPFTETEYAIGVALENEFRIFCLLHKARMVELALARYYEDLNNTGVTIPEFLREDCLKRAQRETAELLGEDRAKFERKYKDAWEKYKELLM